MSKSNELLKKAQTLPQQSGCYLMQDAKGQVIYVGKAKKLKARVISYFNDSPKSLKTEFMVSHVHDFDFILTHSEAESLVLENNLIKENSPKYNIRLRDDKSYPYLLVNRNEPFPRFEYVRRPKKGKNIELYGPFPTGSNISQILRILTKVFELRDCSLSEFKTRKTPCLYYQMKQCSAPCVNFINSEDYELNLRNALNFFQGESKAKKTLEVLKEKMLSLAENEEFERAGLLRDNIVTLEQFLEQSFDQKVEHLDNEKNIDIWSYFEGENEIDLSVYIVRGGLLIGQKNFHFLKNEFIEEVKEEFFLKIIQYYSETQDIFPDFVVVDDCEESLETLGEALKILGEMKLHRNTKKYQALLNMCSLHAKESQRVRLESEDSIFVGLHKLKDLLGLKERPRILECYDVAVWQGSSPTAAQIVFEEGKPDKKRYRYYHLQTRPEGNNDFAMMKEVVSRRVEKLNLPDVFIIDGGIAQVNVVLEVLKEMDLKIPVVGIAKSKELTRGNFKSMDLDKSEERLIIPGRANPYILKKCPALFKIIVSMRDEAHRFSRKLHHKTESERVMSSWIDGVKGINEETKKNILRNLTQTREELMKFTVQDLVNLLGLKLRDAKIVWAFLHQEKN